MISTISSGCAAPTGSQSPWKRSISPGIWCTVTEVYEFYGIRLDRAEQTLDLVRLEASDARLLGIDAQLPVMLFECVTYDDRGRIVEFNRNYVRGDKCNFIVHFHSKPPKGRE